MLTYMFLNIGIQMEDPGVVGSSCDGQHPFLNQYQISYQSNVVCRILATRDMCNALKNHIASVEENLCKGKKKTH